MRFKALAVVVLTCGLLCSSVFAYPPNYSDEPSVVTDNGDEGGGGNGGGYAIPQFHHSHSQLTPHQHQGHTNKHSATHTTLSKTTSPATSVNSAAWAEAISASTAANKPTLQPAFVYSAQVPAHMEPEANRVINAVKLASSTVAAAVAHPSSSSDLSSSASSSPSYQFGSYDQGTTYQGANLNDDVEENGDLSKKHNIGSR